jgi:hypothetical protein
MRCLRERRCGIELACQAEMPDRNAEIAQRDDRGERRQFLIVTKIQFTGRARSLKV